MNPEPSENLNSTECYESLTEMLSYDDRASSECAVCVFMGALLRLEGSDKNECDNGSATIGYEIADEWIRFHNLDEVEIEKLYNSIDSGIDQMLRQ